MFRKAFQLKRNVHKKHILKHLIIMWLNAWVILRRIMTLASIFESVRLLLNSKWIYMSEGMSFPYLPEA